MNADTDDGQQAMWEKEYQQWCAEQDDEDEINRLLQEAADDTAIVVNHD